MIFTAFLIVSFLSFLSPSMWSSPALATITPPTKDLAALPAASVELPADRIGVYHWDRQPGQIDDFSEWINSPVYLAEDFLMSDSWASLEGAGRLSFWQNTQWADKMVWAAYPFPDNQGDLPSAAAGNYNSHYYQLGVNLVNAGMSNANVRFGHEFNGNWYSWSVGKDPNGVAAGEANFAEAFRQFVNTMRSVPNQNFKFVWNPTINQWGVNLANCYPGNQYVDYIGIDIYDQDWKGAYQPGVTPTLEAQMQAWQNNLNNADWGLNMIRDFAVSQNMPIVLPEWGLTIRSDGHGGGDNAYFIQQMYNWINENNVVWNIYFNVNAGDGNHDLYDTYTFPQASAEFQRLWNPSGTLPSPRPVTSGTVYPSGDPGPTAYPSGTTVLEAHTGTFTQPSGTMSRPHGNPWAEDRMLAALIRSGATDAPAVSYSNAPASSALMIRYMSPVNGNIYFSIYVNGTEVASHVEMPVVDRTLPTQYDMVTIPVTIPQGATVTLQIDADDDQTQSASVWDSVNLDSLGFVPSTQGNTHSGSWAAKALFNANTSWDYMVQWPSVSPNTTYTAGFWLKGTGNLSMRILDWQWKTIAAQTFSASNVWVYHSYTFTSGNDPGVGFAFYDDTGQTIGTSYIDDAYLGNEANGTNLLANPGFESGIDWSTWGGDWGTVFTIVQP